MRPRFWRQSLLSVAVVTALTLAAGGHAASDHGAPPHGVGGQAVATRTAPVDELAVFLSGLDGRQPGAERTSKPRLALIAVVVALLVLSASGRRRMALLAPAAMFVLSPPSPQGARAPPPFHF